MHAVVGVFKMDAARQADQQRELESRIIPMVKQQPGFVAGYWSYDAAAGQAHSFLVWQTEAQARGLLEMVRGNARQQSEHGVTPESLTIVEVVGAATA